MNKPTLIIFCLLSSNAVMADVKTPSLPSSKEIVSMYRAEKPIACYAFIDEGNTYNKCVTNSMEALSTSNVSYQDFTVGQLKLLATRSPNNSKRMQYAKYILASIGFSL
ncbi:hypothetical protein IB292_02950 [Vibrio parahaemolyticus]|uniref:Uncharacterized protein n=1 Tax=Vibrio parahaemolyticus TaxID=670 RepID=A0A9Q3UB63_VIBPH|nr:hypothetical protein [Vibrio parahaemolyticus]MCC3803989.1 hypothetical protein [Vibrio parahaemolyticus]